MRGLTRALSRHRARFAAWGRKHPQRRRILGNIGWQSGGTLAQYAMAFVVSVAVAKYLGPTRFGQMNYALALTALVTAVSTLGLRNVVIRDLIQQPARAGETLGSVLGLQIFSGSVAYLALLGYAAWIPEDEPLTRTVLVILGSAAFFRTVAGFEFWFAAHQRFRNPVLTRLCVLVPTNLLKLLMVWQHAGFLAIVWIAAAEIAAVQLLLAVSFFRYGKLSQRLKLRLGRAREILAESWPLILSGTAAAIIFKIDQVMIATMLDQTRLGLYAATVRLSECWYFIGPVIVSSLYPAIVRARENSSGDYDRILRSAYNHITQIALVISVVVCLSASALVPWLFGPAYQGTGPVLMVHVWSGLFAFLQNISGRWLILEKQIPIAMQRTLAGAIANVLLNLLLIPRYGILGAAWATLISFAISGLLYDLVHPVTRPVFVMKLRALLLADTLAALRRARR